MAENLKSRIISQFTVKDHNGRIAEYIQQIDHGQQRSAERDKGLLGHVKMSTAEQFQASVAE
jgi:hypothetical protein